MDSFLQNILGIKTPLFSSGMTKLEKATGHSAIDVRLIVDINSRKTQILCELGLDPRDTTGREMYAALMSAVKQDNIETLLGESDYVLAVIGKDIISLNLIDVIENYHYQLKYEDRCLKHGRRSLCGEIVNRYISHSRTNNKTVLEIARNIELINDKTCYNNHKN